MQGNSKSFFVSQRDVQEQRRARINTRNDLGRANAWLEKLQKENEKVKKGKHKLNYSRKKGKFTNVR